MTGESRLDDLQIRRKDLILVAFKSVKGNPENVSGFFFYFIAIFT